MSTAWYKPNAVPRLVQSFPLRTNKNSNAVVASVEVWNTTCVVTNFGKSQDSHCGILVNPSNPNLLGVRKFPYFPSGGPLPSHLPTKYEHHIMGYVRQWGGMEVKRGMLFPFNVVDGLVHELGGWRLAWHCYLLPPHTNNNASHDRCPVGEAVATPPGGRALQQEYDGIVHTVPPFYEHHDPDTHDGRTPEQALEESYRNSLELCEETSARTNATPSRFAFPLLGAGGRGFPLEVAINIAASQSVQWRNKVDFDDRASNGQPKVLAFGIPNMENAQKLSAAISKYLLDNKANVD